MFCATLPLVMLQKVMQGNFAAMFQPKSVKEFHMVGVCAHKLRGGDSNK